MEADQGGCLNLLSVRERASGLLTILDMFTGTTRASHLEGISGNTVTAVTNTNLAPSTGNSRPSY